MKKAIILALVSATILISYASIASLQVAQSVEEVARDGAFHRDPVSSLSGFPLTDGSRGQKAGEIIKVAASDSNSEDNNQQEDDDGENKDEKQDPGGSDRLWDAAKQG